MSFAPFEVDEQNRTINPLWKPKDPSKRSKGAISNEGNGATKSGKSRSPITRKMSVASSQRLQALNSLEDEYTILRSGFDKILNEMKENQDDVKKLSMKKSIQMIKIKLNRLQELQIDSIQTIDLNTGKTETKTFRKKLTRQVQGTIDEIEMVLENYFN